LLRKQPSLAEQVRRLKAGSAAQRAIGADRRPEIAEIADELPSDQLGTCASARAAANAHDLPSQVARPKGFEPLTSGSVEVPVQADSAL
jgi:hypothetical protein